MAAELLSPTVALTRYLVTPDQELGLPGEGRGTAGVQRYGFRIGACRFVHDLGLDVFIFDYRGYGRSDGVPSEEGLLADARAARRWLTMPWLKTSIAPRTTRPRTGNGRREAEE